MKTTTLTLILFVFAINLGATPSVFGVEKFVDRDTDFEAWITNGKIVYRTEREKTGQAGIYVYKRGSADEVILSGDIERINSIFIIEINSKEKAFEIVRFRLAQFLTDTMSRNETSIINQQLLSLYSKLSDRESVSKLQRYAREVEASFDDNDWTLEFSIITSLGGIEQWKVSGQCFPLRISTFRRTCAEKNGFIKPLLEAK